MHVANPIHVKCPIFPSKEETRLDYIKPSSSSTTHTSPYYYVYLKEMEVIYHHHLIIHTLSLLFSSLRRFPFKYTNNEESTRERERKKDDQACHNDSLSLLMFFRYPIPLLFYGGSKSVYKNIQKNKYNVLYNILKGQQNDCCNIIFW